MTDVRIEVNVPDREDLCMTVSMPSAMLVIWRNVFQELDGTYAYFHETPKSLEVMMMERFRDECEKVARQVKYLDLVDSVTRCSDMPMDDLDLLSATLALTIARIREKS